MPGYDSPFKLPFAANLTIYLILAAITLAIIVALVRHYRGSRPRSFADRWTTQDILVIAIMGVLLEVYDNLIGDQFITPLIQGIPFAHNLALNDLPYMFLLMVGVAVVRKPGCATSMVFLNFLLMQLLYGGDKATPLFWLYGLLQGIFVDLYLLARRGHVFRRNGMPAVMDGLAMGALRAFPAVTAQSAIISPLLTGDTKTMRAIVLYTVLNVIGNGVEAAISAPIAMRIAQVVRPTAVRTTQPLPRPAGTQGAAPAPQEALR